jgi:hypothetical protein
MVSVGRDLHKRYITACVVAADRQVGAEARQLSTNSQVLAGWLTALRSPQPVVLDATLSCWWLERQRTARSVPAPVGVRQRAFRQSPAPPVLPEGTVVSQPSSGGEDAVFHRGTRRLRPVWPPGLTGPVDAIQARTASPAHPVLDQTQAHVKPPGDATVRVPTPHERHHRTPPRCCSRHSGNPVTQVLWQSPAVLSPRGLLVSPAA